MLSQFKLDTSSAGEPILLRFCSRDDLRGDRFLPVVAIEDLPDTFQQQMESLGVCGPTTLFKHVSSCMCSRNALLLAGEQCM